MMLDQPPPIQAFRPVSALKPAQPGAKPPMQVMKRPAARLNNKIISAKAPPSHIHLSPADRQYLERLGRREGDGDINATNPSGAAGLHQFMPIIWIDGIIAWTPDYVKHYVDRNQLQELRADRDFLKANRALLHYDKPGGWIIKKSSKGKVVADQEKTSRMIAILRERFNFDFDEAMTLAQRDDNHSFLVAHHCAPHPTQGDLALAHEQGPLQYCALLKADPKKSAQEVMLHVKGETAGKMKANVKQNPLIYKHKTIADIKRSADKVMGTIIKIAKAITGRHLHTHNHDHHPRHMAKTKMAMTASRDMVIKVNTSPTTGSGDQLSSALKTNFRIIGNPAPITYT